MKNIFYLPALIIVVILIYAKTSVAATNFPWSTTFDCEDWSQSDGLYNTDCDGMTGFGGWTCDNGDGTTREAMVIVDANYSNGGGGKGGRHWIGDGYNVNAGGFSIPLDTKPDELWFRWYMRYESGFTWDPLVFHKIVYMRNGANRPYLGWENWDHLTMIDAFTAHHGNTQSIGYGWDYTMSNGANDANGNKTSDGEWHCYEIHLIMDTDGTDGVGEMWIDGVLIMSFNNANWNTTGGWDSILIPGNQNMVLNGRCAVLDIDDLAISTTGYIGQLSSGAPATPPTAPTGLISSQ